MNNFLLSLNYWCQEKVYYVPCIECINFESMFLSETYTYRCKVTGATCPASNSADSMLEALDPKSCNSFVCDLDFIFRKNLSYSDIGYPTENIHSSGVIL